VAAGNSPADRRDGLGAAFGCSPDVGHQRLERPEPQVIGAPPDQPVEQPGIDVRPDHRSPPQCILGLVVLDLRVRPVFGKVAFADAFELERPLPGRTRSRRWRRPSAQAGPRRERCCSLGATARSARPPHRAPDHRRCPTAPLESPWRGPGCRLFCFAIAMTVVGLDDAPSGA